MSSAITDRSGRLFAAMWRAEDVFLQLRSVPEYALTYHVAGSTRVAKFDRGKCIANGVTARSVALTLPGSCDWRLDGAVDFMHVYVPSQVLKEYAEAHVDGGRVPEFDSLVSATDPWLAGLFMMLNAEAESGLGEYGDSLLLESMRNLLLGHLIYRYSKESPRAIGNASVRPGSKHGLSSRALRIVQEYMRENLAGDISLADLANLVHLSEGHFLRAFRATAGITPYQYLLSLRLQEAKRMLKAESLRIGEIAETLGFATVGQFSEMFRRKVGVTPGQFRRS